MLRTAIVYKEFYGLKEYPFHITPDPKFLYWSQKHQEAFRHLLYGVQSRKGLTMLTGEPGTGKTALLNALIEELKGSSVAFPASASWRVGERYPRTGAIPHRSNP